MSKRVYIFVCGLRDADVELERVYDSLEDALDYAKKTQTTKHLIAINIGEDPCIRWLSYFYDISETAVDDEKAEIKG